MDSKPSPGTLRLIWWITGLLVLIGIATVTRRSLALLAPSPPNPRFPEAASMDAGFARYRLLTVVHIFPGLLFVLLAPLQFVRRLRTRYPMVHRWTGRVVLAVGLIIGGTALVMSPQMSIGGALESSATTFFAILFLFALVKGYLAIRQRQFAEHREWMLRTFATGMAVTTTRPIVGAFFATRRFTHLTPHDFFGIAFWLGFTLHVLAAELWIRHTRPPVRQHVA